MTKRHAIFTASDGRSTSFLLKHWLVSLRDHVDLSDIDVNVLDYGLSERQLDELQSLGILCRKCVKDGQVGDIRLRDIAAIGEAAGYDQVLSIDSGDLIFQADISHLFEQDKEHFRGVCEEIRVPIHHVFMNRDDLPPLVRRRVLDFLYDKPIVNGGFVLGPVAKFQSLWQTFQELGVGYQYYCTDQLILNYFLHTNGFKELENRYNFVLVSMRSAVHIRNGAFHDAAGEIIPVVHNAGMKAFTRKIRNFGYGPQYNQKRWIAPIATRVVIHAGNVWKRLSYGLTRRVDS
jgi:hypothetical protein